MVILQLWLWLSCTLVLEHCAGLVELTLYLQGLLQSLMTILKNTILNSFTDADSELQITHEKKKAYKNQKW